MRANGALWAAMEAARRANLADAGLPPPVPGHWGTSRRALLTGLGALGVAAALPFEGADARAPGRVAIIGGGIAGLTALHYLVEAGVDARLYEGRERIGGRIHTVTQADGTVFERGGQLVNTDHDDIRRLTTTLGVPLVDRKRDAHRSLIMAGGALVAPETLAAALRPIAARIDTDARRVATDFARHAPAIDRLSIAAYLDAHAALIGAPWVRRLLEQTSRTEYGVEPGRASAIELLFNLPVVDGERVEVLGGSDERYVIEGGSSTLAQALAERHRDRIETRRHTIRIAQGRGGRLTLTFLDLSSADADRVIVAVPAPLTRTIEFAAPLAPAWRRFIAEMELGRCEKLQWAMRDAPWRATMGAGGEAWATDAGAPAALAWDATVRGGRDTPVWTHFFGGDQVFDDVPPPPGVLSSAFAAAQPALDDLRRQDLAFDRSQWHRDPMTRGAYANYPPGQLTRHARLLWVEPDGRHPPPPGGRILFAGEHLSDAYPGFMNGAAQTGRLAAESILRRRVTRA